MNLGIQHIYLDVRFNNKSTEVKSEQEHGKLANRPNMGIFSLNETSAWRWVEESKLDVFEGEGIF